MVANDRMNKLYPYVRPELEYNVTTDVGSFLKGMNANKFAANSTECFKRGVNSYFTELPTLMWRYEYGTFQEQVFNTTLYWRNTTNTAMVCLDAVENFYIFYDNRLSLFSDFT